MKISVLIFTLGLILLSATPTGSELFSKERFIVWNIGQGQWATWVTADVCFHFDVGGEWMPAKKIKSLCQTKENRIYLSHWDWDHIGFAGKMQRFLPRLCVALPPEGKSSAKKMQMIAALPKCPGKDSNIESLFQVSESKNSNDQSHVLLVKGLFLVPGDSTSRQEKIWRQHPRLTSAKILLLGHHGSRTSTSEDLLMALPRLQVAVASARAKRYGHPHAETITRLHHHHVPLLRTEDWGNLWFAMPAG